MQVLCQFDTQLFQEDAKKPEENSGFFMWYAQGVLNKFRWVERYCISSSYGTRWSDKCSVRQTLG